jgi:DNA polymerase-3 subunit delta
MITLIHGPAELLRAEALREIRVAIAQDPALAELNTTWLDGYRVAVADLQNACDTLPFLAERRLVVVEGLLHRLATPSKGRPKAQGPEADDTEEPSSAEGRAQSQALLAYLDRVPQTTDLVFLEEELLGGGAVLRRLLELQRDGRARVLVCQTPRKNELPGWIRGRAQLRGARLDAGAVADLAEFVGDDLRLLDQELIKLAAYTAGKRPVTSADVRRLVPATRAANIFELVDALGLGDAPRAGRLMQHALDVDGEQPLRLLGMISRQYRLLIQAKALQAQGAKPPEIARQLGVPEWTAPKMLNQAGRHSFARLERAMERILAADEGIKTGKLGDREAMDLLLAELIQ